MIPRIYDIIIMQTRCSGSYYSLRRSGLPEQFGELEKRYLASLISWKSAVRIRHSQPKKQAFYGFPPEKHGGLINAAASCLLSTSKIHWKRPLFILRKALGNGCFFAFKILLGVRLLWLKARKTEINRTQT